MADSRQHAPRRGSRSIALVAAIALFVASGHPAAPWGVSPAAAVDPPPTEVTDRFIDASHSLTQSGEWMAPPLARRWTVDLGGRVGNPIVVGGRVFVAASNESLVPFRYGARLFAFDLATGDPLWGPIEIGGTYFPIGLTYESGHLITLTYGGLLTARDPATGEEDWSTQLTGQIQFSPPPTGHDGHLYLTGHGGGTTLYSIDASTGEEDWNRMLLVGSGEGPAVDDGGIYLANYCEELRISLAGAEVWSNRHGCSGGGSDPVQVVDGRMYVARQGPDRVDVYDSATGEALESIPRVWNLIVATSGLRITNDRNTFGGIEPASGAVRWRQAGNGLLFGSPVLAGGYAYVGDEDGRVHAIDVLTGELAWSGSANDETEGGVERLIRSIAPAGHHLVVAAGNWLSVFAPPLVSVRGPARAVAGGQVTLVAQAAPGSTVVAWVRPSGTTVPVKLGTRVADATGRAEFRYTVQKTTAIHATVGTASSAFRTVVAVPAAAIPKGAPDTRATTYQLNPAHDGRQPGELIAPPLVNAWHADLPGTVSYAVIVGGRAFVSVERPEFTDYGPELYAFDLRTGRRLWGPLRIAGIYQVLGLASDGLRLFTLDFEGILRALDPATGIELWSVRLPKQWAYQGPPTALGDRIYAAGSGSGSTLHAIDAATGGPIWSRDLLPDSSAPTIASDRILFGDACPNVQALDLASQPQWSKTIGCSTGYSATGVAHDGRFYVRRWEGWGWVFRSSDGGFIRSFQAGPAPAFDGTRGFAVVGGRLRAFDVTTGSTLWTAGDGKLVSAPVVARGIVYVAASDGAVRGFRVTSGAIVWSANAGAPMAAPLEVATNVFGGLSIGEGRLLVSSHGRLTAYTVGATVTGPATAASGSTVTLTARTAPGVPVEFQRRRSGTTGMVAFATVTSDASGVAKATYVADATYAWQVVVMGQASPYGSTTLP